ncbi:unnamed protein product [Ectocarpus sp. 8 AP-2014]
MANTGGGKLSRGVAKTVEESSEENDDRPCMACGSDRLENMVLCDTELGGGRYCDKAYHFACVGLDEEPDGKRSCVGENDEEGEEEEDEEEDEEEESREGEGADKAGEKKQGDYEQIVITSYESYKKVAGQKKKLRRTSTTAIRNMGMEGNTTEVVSMPPSNRRSGDSSCIWRTAS